MLAMTRETCSAKTTILPAFATSPSAFLQKLRHPPRPRSTLLFATLITAHALWQQRRHLAALPGAMVVLKMPPVHAGCAIAAEMRPDAG